MEKLLDIWKKFLKSPLTVVDVNEKQGFFIPKWLYWSSSMVTQTRLLHFKSHEIFFFPPQSRKFYVVATEKLIQMHKYDHFFLKFLWWPRELNTLQLKKAQAKQQQQQKQLTTSRKRLHQFDNKCTANTHNKLERQHLRVNAGYFIPHPSSEWKRKNILQ